MHTPGRFSDHEVLIEPGTLAERAAGRRRLSVRSHHHQGVDRLGEGLRVSARAQPGGAIEAIEAPAARWALGILWHAEELRRSPVLAALVAAAHQHVGRVGVG
jgi:putative glutamine amidotransferase